MNHDREAVLRKSNGHCWYCGADIKNTRWHVDHFYPVIRVEKKMLYPELDHIDNLVPSCVSCNNFKSSLNIEGYRGLVANQFERVLSDSSGLRQLVRLGLVNMTPSPVEFWFEKQNLSIKSELEICNISKDAEDIDWIADKQEFEYYRSDFGPFLCTLRQMGSYWLAIAMSYEWEELGRKELPNGRLAKLQAADWALSLKQDTK